MKKLIIVLIITFFAIPCLAEYYVNPYTGKLENRLTKQRSPAQTKPNTAPRYNPSQKTWEMTPKKNVLKTNPFTGKTEYADPQGKLKYNPFNKKWEYEK